MPFLQRGLLPVASLTSTVPLVAVAPIMVMWFGFDWPSKAAVVVLMTFFPMLVATLAGLQAAGRMERELMHSYAAGYRRTLLDLRLPCAVPFIFSALKVNATLALIGAIVAEFFGSPTVGLGFRISTEAAQMNMGLVWARDRRRRGDRLAGLCVAVRLDRAARDVLAPVDPRPRMTRTPYHSSNAEEARTIDRSSLTLKIKLLLSLVLAARRRLRRGGRQVHGADEVGAAGPVRRLLRRRRQGLLQGAEGLDVTIKPGGPDVSPVQVLAGNGADAHRSTGCPTRWPRARPVCRWSTSRRSSTARA